LDGFDDRRTTVQEHMAFTGAAWTFDNDLGALTSNFISVSAIGGFLGQHSLAADAVGFIVGDRVRTSFPCSEPRPCGFLAGLPASSV
jgi:hypothetical protein